MTRLFRTPFLFLLISMSGCVLAPREFAAEKERAAAAGTAFEAPLEQRSIAELPENPTWRDLLQRAFLASGELEAAYFEWKAALERVNVAAGYPNTNVSVGFEYLFSPGNTKAWDRSTLDVGFDPMQNLSFPTKSLAAGRVALDEARAAGKRFAAARFDLQRRVLTAYLDYALTAEKIRIHHAHERLLRLAAESANTRVRSGATQREVLAAGIAHRLGDDEVKVMDAELPRARATLNALLGRLPDAPLPAPAALPEPRAVAGDAELLAVAVTNNPELAALAQAAAGRADAVDLARQQYFPDINPFAGFTGSAEQAVGAMITLPTTILQIRASIREARAMHRAAQALLRQRTADRGAEFAAALISLRDSERRAGLFATQIRPLAELAAGNARASYVTGAGTLSEVLEAEEALLDVDLMIAEARVEREKRVAEIEALAGVDMEAIGRTPNLSQNSVSDPTGAGQVASPHPRLPAATPAGSIVGIGSREELL